MAIQPSSLSNALSIAVAGLRTSVGLINLASNNIANAQTPGYTEKTASVSNVDYGSSFGGSQITSYGRLTSTALSNNYNAATTQSSYLGTQNGYMTQIQTILDSSATNPTLSNDIAQFGSSWTQYASQPDSTLQQQSVITSGVKLAKDVSTIASEVSSLQAQVVSDTRSSVTSFNTALKQIATLNTQIQIAKSSGEQTGALEDQRDQAINTVAGYTNITLQQRSNGQVAVYTTTGQPLVDGVYATQYNYTGYAITDASGNDFSNVLTGGSLQAQLDFNSSSAAAAASTTPGVGVIAKLNAQLTKFVDALTNGTGSTPSAFATAYSSAATASTAAGATQNGVSVASSFFTTTAGTANPGSFAVNAALIAGTSVLPQTGVQAISDSFSQTANYNVSGLTATSVTYSQLGTSILASMQQIANSVSSDSTTSAAQQTYYKSALASATGVNMDDELATLTALQNSYAATAHIITTVNNLLTSLLQSVG